ncbi:MAG: SPOR domain-containing protein [Xanthomonadales bacterium]|nr:SPOR domain-containing protein [Xanthomonadales bacterium]
MPMFLRLLFLLLLALNLGVGGWLLFGNDDPAPPPTDPGVAELHLLSESSAGAPPGATQEPKRAVSAEAGDRCFSLGPFPTEADVRAALNALTPHVARVQFRTEQSTASRGWWVYLPALPSREQALATARSLADQGVQDYYVVTAGDHQNTISLGLFHDHANAQRRQAQIAGLGVQPKLTERTEQVPIYYVDYAIAANTPLDWTNYVAKSPDLSVKPMGCF